MQVRQDRGEKRIREGGGINMLIYLAITFLVLFLINTGIAIYYVWKDKKEGKL